MVNTNKVNVLDMNISLLQVHSREEEKRLKNKGKIFSGGIKILAAIFISCILSLFTLGNLFYMYMAYRVQNIDWVGYQVGDNDLEPLVIQDELYFPIPSYPFGEYYHKDSCMEFLGILCSRNYYEKKINVIEGYLYYITRIEVWVDKRYENQDYLQTWLEYNEYAKASCLEQPERTRQVFEKESSYIMISNYDTRKNQCIIPKEMVMELEEQFGECTYDRKDFTEMAEIYYITANPYFDNGSNKELKLELAKELPLVGDYIGTIFVDEEEHFYYCNRDNVINNEMTQKLKKVMEDGEIERK